MYPSRSIPVQSEYNMPNEENEMKAFQGAQMSSLIHAISLAGALHAGQERKLSLVPGVHYLGHPMEVAGMVMLAGGSLEAVEAAWLHDAIEDTKPEANAELRILKECGPEVLALVLECTEIGTGQGREKAPWQERKDAYIAHFTTISPEALLICGADRLHNLRSLWQVVCVHGDEAYANLVKSVPPEKRKERTLWFNESVYQAATLRLNILAALDYRPIWVGIQALLSEIKVLLKWLR